jgi:SAM-dependent methyltransferase
MSALAPELSAARMILDLGCGNGAYLREFARVCSAARIVGADLSPDMLSAARQHVGAGAMYVRADANELPLKANSFDLVLCSHVLPFVSDLDRCVRGIARCLKPGGVLVATLVDRSIRTTLGDVLTPEQWNEFQSAVFTEARSRRGARTRLDDRAYRDAFHRAGLAVEMRTAPFSVGWPQIEEWVRVRWIPVASDSARADIGKILARLKDDPKVAGITLDLTERLILGRKTPDADRV